MKHLLKFLLILMPVFGTAQDAVVTLTPSMFDKTTDQQFLAATDGWLFRLGNDTAWAGKNIDIAGWRKMNPIALSAKYANKDGRLECWFRIKVKLDSAFRNKVFGIKYSAWGAADLYVNGRLISSFGNTGKDGAAFHEFSPFNNLALPVSLNPGTEYSIAVHFVDHPSRFHPRRLQSEDLGLISFIRITGPAYNSIFFSQERDSIAYSILWISVCATLSLLFWLLVVQNPFEKTFRPIAFGTTFIALSIFCLFYAVSSGISYITFFFCRQLAYIFEVLSCIAVPLILVSIFKRKMAAGVKIFLAISLAGILPIDFLPRIYAAFYTPCFAGPLFAICMYYIITSWKKLKGAQWAIVTGILLSFVSGVLLAVLDNFGFAISAINSNLLISGYAFFFPLSLMIYVATRFREMLKEVLQNADQVVLLSNEKKEDALNRQRVLEEEVNRQTAEIRSNQTRLIQSEKMASLGELTAGIAHEIQNPLNFVNNFSEVNTELIAEMELEIEKGDMNEVKALAADIKANQQKINQHGKRADFIVKGMLEHSRTSKGEKTLTNISVLADEFLKLSYHGLRAKDKKFNAELVTHFDEDLPNVNIAQQDIGRVLLNLFNNAFYAVNEKAVVAGTDYKPTVTVSTCIAGAFLLIAVRDNGAGIPQKILDKIYQPFFTTKPPGQGTGLGLSLSYDIVKANGGEINVETQENTFTQFNVQLPLI